MDFASDLSGLGAWITGRALGVKSGEMGLSSGSGNHGLGNLEEAALPLCSSASTLAIQRHPDCCYISGTDVM